METDNLELLCAIIIKNLKKEFETKHLSKNLINTIRVEKISDEINIHIPAQTYNMLLYQSKGVVVHTNHGSYASKLDTEGSSFYVYPGGTRKGARKITPGNHVGYVDRIINESIEEWRLSIANAVVEEIEG